MAALLAWSGVTPTGAVLAALGASFGDFKGMFLKWGGPKAAGEGFKAAKRFVRNIYFAPLPLRNIQAYQDMLHWYCPVIFFQLYGYCYQDSNDIPDTLTAITELGSPLEMIQLLQTSWEDRFRVSNNCLKGTYKRTMNMKKHDVWNIGYAQSGIIHIYSAFALLVIASWFRNKF